MRKLTTALVMAACLMGAAVAAHAAYVLYDRFVHYSGAGVSDDDVLFETELTGPASIANYDKCQLMSSTGSVEVLVSLDGITYATAPLSLQDQSADSSDPVLATTPGGIYGFVVKARRLKVVQAGATAAAAVMNCWA